MHVEFEPYHRSEILHGHLHLGGSNPGGGADRSQQSLPDPGRTALAARHGRVPFFPAATPHSGRPSSAR